MSTVTFLFQNTTYSKSETKMEPCCLWGKSIKNRSKSTQITRFLMCSIIYTKRDRCGFSKGIK